MRHFSCRIEIGLPVVSISKPALGIEEVGWKSDRLPPGQAPTDPNRMHSPLIAAA